MLGNGPLCARPLMGFAVSYRQLPLWSILVAPWVTTATVTPLGNNYIVVPANA